MPSDSPITGSFSSERLPPLGQRAIVEAEEFRTGIKRAALFALVSWPLFFLFDLYWRATLYPSAGLLWFVFHRLLGVAAFLIPYTASLRPGLSIPTMTALVAVPFSAAVVSMSLIALEAGGLASVYGQGLAFFFLGTAVLIPSPWRRSLAIGLPSLIAYPGTMALAAGFDQSVAAQWRDPTLQAIFAGQVLLSAALLAFAVVASHLLWGSRRQLYEARRLGRYRLKSSLGEGGMNEVWLAWDDTLKREVAVKILRTGSGIDEARRRRFEREARATSALTSPHTVRIFDYGVSDDGIAFFAMEYLRGLDLHNLVRRHGPLDVRRTVHFARQACRALAEAHQAGLVHRDVKPANLFVSHVGGEEDFLKVLDFGVARQLDDPAAHVTRVGSLVGTPLYMSPEAFGNGAITPRSDVYSLGATFYFVLTGKPPFEGSDAEKLKIMHERDKAMSVGARRGEPLPASLEAVVMRCLAKRPLDRYADCGELYAALEQVSVNPWTSQDARTWWEMPRLAGAATADEAEPAGAAPERAS